MPASVNVAHLKVTPPQLAQRRFLKEMIRELTEHRKLIKNPIYYPLYRNSYAKKLGRLEQVIPGLAEETSTMFFI